jgi:hypothetical protein
MKLPGEIRTSSIAGFVGRKEVVLSFGIMLGCFGGGFLVVSFFGGVFFAAGLAVLVFSLPVPPCPRTSDAAQADNRIIDRMTNPHWVLSRLPIDSSLENADRSQPRSHGFPIGLLRPALERRVTPQTEFH